MCAAAGRGPGSATGALFGLGFLLPLLAGPASTSARCRGWRCRRPRRCSSGPRCRDGRGVAAAAARRLGGGGLGRRGGAAGRGAVRRVPVGPRRLRPARRAAAAAWRPSAARRCCRSSPCSAGLALGEAGRRLARRELRAAVVPALVALRRAGDRSAGRAAPARRLGSPVRTVTIAAVQGNVPRLGLDFNAQRRAVLDNHVAGHRAARRGRRRRPPPAPGPGALAGERLGHRPAAQPRRRRGDRPGRPRRRRADRARHGAGRPGRTRRTNSVLVWAARGRASSTAPTSGGSSPSASTCRGGRSSGCCPSTPTGRGTSCRAPERGRRRGRASGWAIAICWEIAFDDLVADSVAAGAQVLAVPSNNATFGRQRHDLPAAGDVPRAGRRARPRRARRRPPAGSAPRSPPTAPSPPRPAVHPRCAGRRNPAAGHHYARRSTAGRPRVGTAGSRTGRGRAGPRSARGPPTARTITARRAGRRRRGRGWLRGRRGRCWW